MCSLILDAAISELSGVVCRVLLLGDALVVVLTNLSHSALNHNLILISFSNNLLLNGLI